MAADPGVPENETEASHGHRKRIPVPVAVVACLYLIVGIGGFIAHFKTLGAPGGIWVEITECLAIVCGAFLLRARNWARWLAVAWMALHVTISLRVIPELAIHSVFLVLIVCCLFYPGAGRFFRG